MSQWFKSAMFLLMGAQLLGCRKTDEETSRGKINPADRNAKNVALIVGSPNDLPGVATDVAKVSQMIKDSDLGYEVVVINNAGPSQIMSKAREIGAMLSANSTVLFYYSGHGSQSGTLIGQGYQPFRMSSVAKEIANGYGKGKFKRFIAIMDSCFSGQNVNGNNAMFLNEPSDMSEQDQLSASVGNISSDVKPRADSDVPFEQALVLAAAQRNQESLDAGAGVGGIFTSSWRSAMKDAFGKSQRPTLGAILDATKRNTQSNSGGSHTPVWKAMPESMLTEPLGGSGSGSLPLAEDIFVALGDASDGAMMFVSLPASVSLGTVSLCKGEKVACTSGTGGAVMNFVAAQDLKINGRVVFRGEKNVTVADGDVLTIVLKKTDGSALEARSMTVKKK